MMPPPQSLTPLHTPRRKTKKKKNSCSYQLIHAEPVLDAAIEPERMEMLKEVKKS